MKKDGILPVFSGQTPSRPGLDDGVLGTQTGHQGRVQPLSPHQRSR